jgi:hypothetical protein
MDPGSIPGTSTKPNNQERLAEIPPMGYLKCP